METTIQLTPTKWVTETVLRTITGFKPNTIRRMREKSWANGVEYMHFSPEGTPGPNSACLYCPDAIQSWIEKQIRIQPHAKRFKNR